MKFNISWLKEYLETNASLDQICEQLELLGFPCEQKFPTSQALEEIYIAKIIAKEPHPNADKLNIYTIEDRKEIFKIVCGDKTLEINDYVPFAKPGTLIPSIKTILKEAKIRGIVSPGMLCSPSELCLPIQNTGVMKCFAEDFGKNISESYEDEGIVEIEVTPNRGDMLSIKGIARELSHHIGKFKQPQLDDFLMAQEGNIFFEIKSPDCLGLITVLIEYQPMATGPKIAKRLQMIGQNVSNIDVIDTINYVSHETGQPMHAFDYDKIQGKLSIENLKNEEDFLALNGEKITLQKGSLVIKDDKEIISWPGIIGGENTKTTLRTKNILLETGMFKTDPIQRRANKIETNAGKLFERGIDPESIEASLNALLAVLKAKPIKIQKQPPKLEPKIINFDLQSVKNILGKNVTKEDVAKILAPRGFEITESKDEKLGIKIPGYRIFDIETQNCIIEELAAGKYGEIESINLSGSFGSSPEQYSKINFQNNAQRLDNFFALSISEIARNNEFWECIHPSVVQKEEDLFEICEKGRKISNPMNSKHSFLRGTMIPQLIETLSWHSKNSYRYSKFFEIGPIYKNGSQENIFTAIFRPQKKAKNDIKQLMRLLYAFCSKIDIDEPDAEISQDSWQKKGAIFKQNDIVIAKVGSIKKDILKEFDKEDIYALEIYIERISRTPKIHQKISHQAPVYRDLSFHLPTNFASGHLIKFLQSLGYIFEIFDIYPSSKLNIERNMGIKFAFLQDEPLTSEQIDEKLKKIRLQVEQKFGIIAS